MTRTPDEIKRGLECCQLAFGFRECGSRCPYYRDSNCGALLAADALALIKQLEERAHKLDLLNLGLLTEKAQLEAERDAAVEELRRAMHCPSCVNWRKLEKAAVCFECRYGRARRFEWRGVQKEDSDETHH